jgi:GntR family transcriptional regulator
MTSARPTGSHLLRDARPLPVQVADRLRERISAGEWPPGSRLPSEHELAVEYGVSRPTVRSALRRLAAAGLLRVRHGAGTFVTAHGRGIRAGLQQLRSTSRVIAEQGHTCQVVYRTRELRRATAEEAARLESTARPRVVVLERCFLSDEEVVAFEHALVDADLLPEDLDPAEISGSVFEFLEPRGLLPDQAVATVSAVHDPGVGWGPGRPDPPLYLCLEQVQYLPGGEPLSWSRTWFVQAKFVFGLVRTP